jgi:formylglycine-generating enzyme required for sulfatase activity
MGDRDGYCGIWRKVGAPEAPQSSEKLDETELTVNIASNAGNTLVDLSVGPTLSPGARETAVAKPTSATAASIKARPDAAAVPTRGYFALWSSDSIFEAISSFGLDPAGHQDELRDRIARGFRPVALSVAPSVREGPLVVASVWHRPKVSEELKDHLAERQARAAVALVRLGEAGEVWPLLEHSIDPRLRSFIVNWLKPFGADPRLIAAELKRVGRTPFPAANASSIAGSRRGAADNEPASRNGLATAMGRVQPMDAILFDRDTSTRRALLLALGTYGSDSLSPAEREPIIAELLDLYKNDPDAGIHGAAEWVLRRWKQQIALKTADLELPTFENRDDRRWFVNSEGQGFTVIEGPVEFMMGSPSSEPDREPVEPLRRRHISNRFAISTKEVTVRQFQRFQREYPQFGLGGAYLEKYSPDPDGPMINVSWFAATAYCNWLSKEEGLPPEQWCYERNKNGAYDYGMTIPANVLKRTGYRLPTEAEWEYACRSGAVTSRYHGISVQLLGAYAWYSANSRERAWPCGSALPNDLGLFDMLGNVFEWCHDGYQKLETEIIGKNADEANKRKDANMENYRMHRGGGFIYPQAIIRSAKRDWCAPANQYGDDGFRIARTCD